jgi:hypothetical protein
MPYACILLDLGQCYLIVDDMSAIRLLSGPPFLEDFRITYVCKPVISYLHYVFGARINDTSPTLCWTY